MNYAQNYDPFFLFFIKVVFNKSKAYSFLIIGIMHLQKILLSVIMLDSNFSLLSRALEYIISTEVLSRVYLCFQVLFFMRSFKVSFIKKKQFQSDNIFRKLGKNTCYYLIHVTCLNIFLEIASSLSENYNNFIHN